MATETFGWLPPWPLNCCKGTMADSAAPGFVYRILTVAEWASASEAGSFGGAALDHSSGFIHLSTAAQVPGTLALFFKETPCVVVKLATSKLDQAALKFEPVAARGGELFPHLFAESLPVAEPVFVAKCDAKDGKVTDSTFLE